MPTFELQGQLVGGGGAVEIDGQVTATSSDPILSLRPYLYLIATKGVTLSGSSVVSWADQSGNGNHYSQSNGSARPFYSSSVPNLNNQPSIHFPVGSVLRTSVSASVFSFLCNGSGSVVFGAGVAPLSSDGYLFDTTNNGIVASGAFAYYFIPPTSILRQSIYGTGGVIVQNQDAMATSSSFRVEMAFDTSQSPQSYVKVNNQTAVVGNPPAHLANGIIPVPPTIGGSSNAVFSGPFTGKIFAIVMFNRTLTTGEKAIVNNEIKRLTGLT